MVGCGGVGSAIAASLAAAGVAELTHLERLTAHDATKRNEAIIDLRLRRMSDRRRQFKRARHENTIERRTRCGEPRANRSSSGTTPTVKETSFDRA